MPEPNYGALKVTVPKASDYAPGGPDVPRAIKEMVDSVGTGQGKGKIIIAQETGAAAFKAMKGDATLAEDGTLTVADGAVSSRKLKPTTGLVKGAGAQLNLTTGYQDIPGTTLEITPAVASVIRIWALFGLLSLKEVVAEGTVNLDGADQATPIGLMRNEGASRIGGLAPATYALALTAGVKHVIKLRARKASEAGSGLIDPPTSHYLYDLVAS